MAIVICPKCGTRINATKLVKKPTPSYPTAEDVRFHFGIQERVLLDFDDGVDIKAIVLDRRVRRYKKTLWQPWYKVQWNCLVLDSVRTTWLAEARLVKQNESG